jgi:tetratricopeptide (TPR) repeat protein
MNTMKRLPMAAVLLLVLAAVAVFFVRSQRTAGGAQVAPASRASSGVNPAHAAISGTPSATNVSTTFRNQLALLEQKVTATPGDTASLIALGRLKLDAHDLPGAVAALQAYVDLVPGNRQAWLDLANAFGLNKDWDGAEEALDQMLVLFPEDGAAQYNMGAVLANDGRLPEAMPWWHKAVNGADTEAATSARTALAQVAGSAPSNPVSSPGSALKATKPLRASGS